MRLIHTSDWHLGQNFKGFDRHAEHQVFLDWLLGTLADRKADALLIAGDIFDQANPSAEAQRLFYTFLAQARARCPQLDIVVIAGNHDSAGRIDAPHPLLSAFGVKVVGLYSARGELTADTVDRLVLPLTDADGAVAAWVLAVPFMRLGNLDRTDDNSYQGAMAQAYAQVAAAAAERVGPDQALVVMGHLHAQGGAVSEDSERRLVIGGEEALAASIFPDDAAYVALGHLHMPQSVGAEHIRYSGSPLPLSFSELNYPHQVVEVDLRGATTEAIRPIPAPRPAQLLRVPAEPRPLEEALAELAQLAVAPVEVGLEPLLEVQVLEAIAPTDMRARVEAALEGKAVRLTGIQRHRPQREPGDGVTPETSVELADLRPLALFERLLAEANPDLEEREEVLSAFGELLQLHEQEGQP